MKLYSILPGCLIALLIMMATGTSPQTIYAEDVNGQLQYDGVARSYSLHLPSSYDGNEAVPMLIVLHPFASSGRAMARLTGLNAVAETQGFIAVYPDALNFGWDDGRSAYPELANADPVDDVGFIAALIDQLAEAYRIDADQISVTGFASGGTMAFRLACAMPERFAHVITVGALLWDFHATDCPETAAPVDILMAVGTQDTYYPLTGREVVAADQANAGIDIRSSDETLDFWRERNECTGEVQVLGRVSNVQAYTACKDGTSISLIELDRVGHQWPRLGDYTLNQSGFDMAEIIGSYLANDAHWTDLIINAPHPALYSGLPRNYRVYVPPNYDPATPTPLVIGLHGRPDNGYGFAYLSDMNRIAAEQGFIVAYPDGIEEGWNYTKGFEDFGYNFSDVDDVDFLSILADDLAIDLNLDTERMYVMGFSNGGFMTQRMACDSTDKFAAYAIIGATLFPGFVDYCETTPPVPILFIHGTDDPSVPWSGITYGESIVTLSMEDTITFWVVHNQCQRADTEISSLPINGDSPGTLVNVFTFGGCADHAPVLFYAIQGGGHTIPGVPRLPAERFGLTSMDMDAPQVIWDFFAQHTLSE